jgi:aryl-alcohol dehydrogenase-like predicted oxidoreductase
MSHEPHDRGASPLALPLRRRFGRTDLEVSALGIGGGNGIVSDDVSWAVDQGINVLFYSADLHHVLYGRMSHAIRTLCRRGSAARDGIVLVCATYIMRPAIVPATVFDLFAELGVDYIDVLLWGMVDAPDAAAMQTTLDGATALRGPGTLMQDLVERLFGASDALRRMGAVRYVGMSFHDPVLAARCAASGELDVVMVRTNIAHRRARDVVLRPLGATAPAARPGTIVFNAARGIRGLLWTPQPGVPPDVMPPTPGDCYRYVLSQPAVDVCVMGPRTREDIAAAVAALERGTCTEAELASLEAYGDLYRGRPPAPPAPSTAASRVADAV